MNDKAIMIQEVKYRIYAGILGLLLLLPSCLQLGHVLEGHQHLGCTQNTTHLHELDHNCDVLAFDFSALSYTTLTPCVAVHTPIVEPTKFWYSDLFINRITSKNNSRGPPILI